MKTTLRVKTSWGHNHEGFQNIVTSTSRSSTRFLINIREKSLLASDRWMGKGAILKYAKAFCVDKAYPQGN